METKVKVGLIWADYIIYVKRKMTFTNTAKATNKYYKPMPMDSVLVFWLSTNKMKIDIFNFKSFIFCQKTDLKW